MTYAIKRKVCTGLVCSAAALMAACTQTSVKTAALPVQEALIDTTEAIPYALPRGFLKMQFTWDGKSKFPQVKLLGTDYAPDKNARYLLRADPSAFANDKFTFEVESGLLKAINTTNEDKTLGAVAKAAEIAKSIVTGVAGVASTDKVPFDRTILFDPYEPGDLNTKLRSINLQADIEVASGADQSDGGAAVTSGTPAECPASLCYRVPTTATVTIRGINDFNAFSADFQGQVADTSQTYGYNIERAACIAKVTGLTLTSGMLTKVDVDKPSEVMGCFEIVPDLIETVLPLPWGS